MRLAFGRVSRGGVPLAVAALLAVGATWASGAANVSPFKTSFVSSSDLALRRTSPLPVAVAAALPHMGVAVPAEVAPLAAGGTGFELAAHDFSAFLRDEQLLAGEPDFRLAAPPDDLVAASSLSSGARESLAGDTTTQRAPDTPTPAPTTTTPAPATSSAAPATTTTAPPTTTPTNTSAAPATTASSAAPASEAPAERQAPGATPTPTPAPTVTSEAPASANITTSTAAPATSASAGAGPRVVEVEAEPASPAAQRPLCAAREQSCAFALAIVPATEELGSPAVGVAAAGNSTRRVTNEFVFLPQDANLQLDETQYATRRPAGSSSGGEPELRAEHRGLAPDEEPEPELDYATGAEPATEARRPAPPATSTSTSTSTSTTVATPTSTAAATPTSTFATPAIAQTKQATRVSQSTSVSVRVSGPQASAKRPTAHAPTGANQRAAQASARNAAESQRRRPTMPETYSPLANGADEEEANILTRYMIPAQLTRLSAATSALATPTPTRPHLAPGQVQPEPRRATKHQQPQQVTRAHTAKRQPPISSRPEVGRREVLAARQASAQPTGAANNNSSLATTRADSLRLTANESRRRQATSASTKATQVAKPEVLTLIASSLEAERQVRAQAEPRLVQVPTAPASSVALAADRLPAATGASRTPPTSTSATTATATTTTTTTTTTTSSTTVAPTSAGSEAGSSELRRIVDQLVESLEAGTLGEQPEELRQPVRLHVAPEKTTSTRRPQVAHAQRQQPSEARQPRARNAYARSTRPPPAPVVEPHDFSGSSELSSEGAAPGRPGVDYPTHAQVPRTSFDCRNFEQSGFYADVESDCQAYHSCHKGRGGRHTFLCPNGTLFSQELLTCDWWYNVECSASKLYLPASSSSPTTDAS